jgi:putative Mg2+ transporter-C (MgtC) family protein
MPLHPGWEDLAVRILLTLAAGAAIGFNREEGSHAAGLRTTMLVCLAASLAMIEANLLTDSTGKTAGSFVVYDLMRFPLGILSGMGFIGAGAILRRGDLIKGVTTAATLWFVTVVGLCMGAGLIYIGVAATAMGVAILWLMEGVDRTVRRERRADLTLVFRSHPDRDMRSDPLLAPFKPRLLNERRTADTVWARYELRWEAQRQTDPCTNFLQELLSREGVVSVEWRAGDVPEGESKGTDATALKPNWLKT